MPIDKWACLSIKIVEMQQVTSAGAGIATIKAVDIEPKVGSIGFGMDIEPKVTCALFWDLENF